MKKTRIRFSCLAVLMALVLLLPGCGKSDGKEPASSSGAEETVVDDFTSEENLVTMHRALTPVFDGTFRSQMLDEEKMIYDALKQHIIVEKRTDDVVVDFSSVGKEFSESVICLMANGVYWAFMYDYPEAEVSMFTESTAQFEDGKLQTLTIKLREYYENGYAEMDTVRSNIKAAVEEIMSARASDSRYDTVKAIHDYVCKYATYDFALNDENFEIAVERAHSALPLFGSGSRGKRFVCEGYAKAFKLLCERCDVPCFVVGGNAMEEPHAWNVVQMEDGKWYGVDVTWDDPGDDNDPIRYTHFLCGKNTPDVDEYMLVRKGFENGTFSQIHVPSEALVEYGASTSYSVGKLVWLLFYPELADEAYRPA